MLWSPSIYLPSRFPAAAFRAMARLDDPKSKGLSERRILIVEDEAMIALDLEMSLEDAGAEVVGPAMDIETALDLATDEDDEIDAAILDVDMHGKDAFAVAEALAARGVPFLFHTGHASQAELRRRFGDVPVCIKPTRHDVLLHHLAKLVD
ncbi:response regulator [Consotaella salsifontis]|nr:response regulator [Consotaella salsifontis]